MSKRTLFKLGIVFLGLILLSQIVLGASIGLYFKNADIKDVFRALADQAGVNIVVDNQINAVVTIHLSRLSFAEAMDVLCKNNGLEYTKQNQVYHVYKPLKLQVNYTNKLLLVDAKDVSLKQLFAEINRKTGSNYVLAPDLDELITIFFHQTPLDDGIKVILMQANCLEEKVGNVSLIRKKSTAMMSFTVLWENNLLTVDAKNIPLPILLRSITEKTGVSIVPDQNLNQNVGIFFQNLPLGDGLASLCDANNLQLTKDNLVWRIANRNGKYKVRFKDNLVSIDADEAEINGVVNEITRQTGINIMVAKEIRGNVTVHLNNVAIDQALMAIADSQNWTLEKQAKYFYIRPNTNSSQNIRIVYNPESQRFDLDIQTAPLTAILFEMARKADINIVILSQVNWTVNNVRLRNQSLDQTLQFLMKGTIFTYMKSDSTYLVGDGLIIRPENQDFAYVKVYPIKYLKADQLLNTLPPVFPRQNFTQIQEKNALIVSAPPSVHDLFVKYLEQVDVETIEDRTDIIKINYLKADDVLKLLPQSIPKTDIVVIKEQNALAVTGPQNLLSQVRQYVEKIDQVNPMIVFDILVVQVSGEDNFYWSTAISSMKGDNLLSLDPTTGTIVYNPAGANKNISILTSLISQGKGKILANPTISTLNGYQASFSVTTKRNYKINTSTETSSSGNTITNETVKTYDSGLSFAIVPWVSANNQITMDIKPKYSEFGAPPQGSDLPTTFERSTETTIRVNNKETVIISGLRKSNYNQPTSKIPLLGDLPLIGHLFKTNTKEETEDEFVIVITPYLVYDDASRVEAQQKILDRYSPELKKGFNQSNATNPINNNPNGTTNNSVPEQTPPPAPSPTPAPKL